MCVLFYVDMPFFYLLNYYLKANFSAMKLKINKIAFVEFV